MDKSIEYLTDAIESAQQSTCRDELPIVETYLNIANAHQFMSRYQEAVDFAEKADIFAGQKQLGLEK